MLKACVINANITPPHIHKLEYLSSLAKLSVSDEQLLWLREITTFSIETCYPKQKFDFYKKATLVYTKLWSGRCEEIYQWLKKTITIFKKIKPSVIRQVTSYKEALRIANVQVSQLIVFGSQVKGKAHSWSDIDLAVISPSFGKDYHNELVMLLGLCDQKSLAIEPHPFHPDDLKDKWSTFAYEIKKYGQVIV